LHGEVTEFLDGRVQVAKWGSKDAVISEDELSAIRLSLDNLDNSDGGETDSGHQLIGGKQLLGRLSKKNPLKILLNTSGVNSSQENAVRLIAIDIGSDVYFKNYNNGRKWGRMSLERKLAHEIGHATTGISDIGHFNVRRTDNIMKKINGTKRKYYNNWSTWCLSCK
jgi:hypothetical protein